MAKEFSRSDRVQQQMKRELALLVDRQIKDPRLGMTTITDVEVTRDMSHAKVFYTLLKGDPAETHAVLQASAGFLRSELGRRIKLYKVPELHFHFDASVERGRALDQLIGEVVRPLSEDAIDDASPSPQPD